MSLLKFLAAAAAGLAVGGLVGGLLGAGLAGSRAVAPAPPMLTTAQARPIAVADGSAAPLPIHLHRPADVAAMRNALIRRIWNTAGLDAARRPTRTAPEGPESRWAGLDGLAAVTRLESDVALGFSFVSHLLTPARSNGRLALYHQGHDGDATLGKDVVAAFLRRGYTVLTFAMPGLGDNRAPEFIDHPKYGRLRFANHAQPVPAWIYHNLFARLEDETFSPYLLFLDQILRALNHAVAERTYRDITMIGLSGGGWTTTLYAALDPRIAYSFPLAGSLPFHQRYDDPVHDVSDWENYAGDIYRIANYMELYVLGAAGTGRRQAHFLNEFDACCFRRSGSLAHPAAVTAALARLGMGGDYQFIIDQGQTGHVISPLSLERIFALLGE